MMDSYEPTRTIAYSNDLRWRMVYQRKVLKYNYAEISRNLGVDKSTVQRTVVLFDTTGAVDKKVYPKENSFRKLTLPAQLLILNLIIERPSAYLSEIQQEIENTLQIEVSISTICKFLKENGFSRQKLQRVALQDLLLRDQFMSDASVFSQEMFVFVDETGADQRNCLRKYGYSLRGKTPVSHEFVIRGERVSAIACMSSSGILDIKTVKGTSDGDIFYDFTQTHLLPYLMPYNGINMHSVVVLDNCSIHHVYEVRKAIEDVGALVLFLPPYSPDLNPIEEVFSKVKYSLKTISIELPHITDLNTLLLASFTTATMEDCVGYINHCKIYY